MYFSDIQSILGDKSDYLLNFSSNTFGQNKPEVQSIEKVEKVFAGSDRNNRVLGNIFKLFNHGRLSGTGYLSILPVDQDVEHSAGMTFAANPIYFDPEKVVNLAIEGGCNAVTSSLGALGIVSRKYAHKIPFIVKLNHNQTLTFPVKYQQTQYSSVKQAWDLGAVGVGATIYFGSDESNIQIKYVSELFAEAHELGLFTVLWCYTRNPSFNKEGQDFHTAADLTGQANRLGVTIEADIIKQKLPTNNGGYVALSADSLTYGHFDERIYTNLSSDHPIDLTRYQVANCYMGKIPLISSGGASGENDFHDAIESAVINKRAGGTGLILGRKAFQRDFSEGVHLLNSVQDVYLMHEIGLA